MSHSEFKTKLSPLGLNIEDKIIKKCLEAFSKKKHVSPQAISSLTRVFNMCEVTDYQVANTLAEVSISLNDKLATAGKLLFFGEHILKSPEGLEALQPIKAMLASNYRAAGEFIVENAQK